MRTGTADRILLTRVRDQERLKASTRHAMHVVRYRTNSPEARDEAIRTSSVSL